MNRQLSPLYVGTRSKIFLQLHGNLGQNTICFYLHNPFLPHRKLFVWGDISFFVINTANPIGDIQVCLNIDFQFSHLFESNSSLAPSPYFQGNNNRT